MAKGVNIDDRSARRGSRASKDHLVRGGRLILEVTVKINDDVNG